MPKKAKLRKETERDDNGWTDRIADETAETRRMIGDPEQLTQETLRRIGDPNEMAQQTVRRRPPKA